MKQSFLISFIVMLIILSACGRWADNIKLSIRNVEFKAAGDSVIVTTKGDWWWVTGISVDDTNYYNFEGIDILSNNYRIAKDCFVVERRDKNTLFIKLDTNPLSTDRIVKVELEAGDYFDRVTITQKHF